MGSPFLTDEQYRAMEELARILPDETNPIANHVSDLHRAQRLECILIVSRLLANMDRIGLDDRDGRREAMKEVLFYRLTELDKDL